MSEAELKAGCEIDLSFPVHGDKSPSAHLRAVADFMDAEAMGPEAYLGGPSVERLERKIADLLGKPAALWCPTGTMAQGIAARLHAEATGRSRILLHPTSHLELHEHRGYAHAHGLAAGIIGDWSRPLTADDLEAGAACAFIELGQRHNGGALPTWAALEAIKARADALDLPLHMDGARLWAARPYYDDRSLAEICAGFSSVYVSLYKDIGASGGAVLAGEMDFIAAARIWMGRLGGALVSPWPMVPDALRLLDQRLAAMSDYVARARIFAARISGLDGIEVTPDPPHTNLFHIRLPGLTADAVMAARDAAARETGVWLGNRCWYFEADPVPALEINIGERALAAPLDRLVEAVAEMAKAARG